MSLQGWLEVRQAGVIRDEQMSVCSCHIARAACNCFLYALAFSVYLSNALPSICLKHLYLLEKKLFPLLINVSRMMLWREILFVILFPPPHLSFLILPFYGDYMIELCVALQVFTYQFYSSAPLPVPVNQCLPIASCPLAFLPGVPVGLHPNRWEEPCCKRSREGQNQVGGEYQPVQRSNAGLSK